MIQDIFPSRFDNGFFDNTPTGDDRIMLFDKEGRLFSGTAGEGLFFPSCDEIGSENVKYLFSIDNRKYFLCLDENVKTEKEGYEYLTVRQLRDRFVGAELFAAFTAYHLWKWYVQNRYCGCCGEATVHSEKERALVCKHCGNVIYPRINPAVIVGVIKGECLLITRYRTGYGHNALVAGFTEIGETLEETVAREVMEETGISVKNIRYYKSQPWGMAQDILMGFFCEADTDDEIKMQEDELKYAGWVSREDIVLQPNNHSLTNEMMTVFKQGKI